MKFLDFQGGYGVTYWHGQVWVDNTSFGNVQFERSWPSKGRCRKGSGTCGSLKHNRVQNRLFCPLHVLGDTEGKWPTVLATFLKISSTDLGWVTKNDKTFKFLQFTHFRHCWGGIIFLYPSSVWPKNQTDMRQVNRRKKQSHNLYGLRPCNETETQRNDQGGQRGNKSVRNWQRKT